MALQRLTIPQTVAVKKFQLLRQILRTYRHCSGSKHSGKNVPEANVERAPDGAVVKENISDLFPAAGMEMDDSASLNIVTPDVVRSRQTCRSTCDF
jgi:hypothetical protein